MMSLARRVLGAAVLVTCAAGNVPVAAQTSKPDPVKGKALVQRQCAACHGVDGKAVSGEFPNLAAQYPEYLAKQLRAFRAPEGGRAHRKSDVMQRLAAPLSEQDIVDVAAYYSSLPPVWATPRIKDTSAGRKVFMEGNVANNLPACVSCHRPNGSGIQPDFPRLAGQQPAYVEAQLKDWMPHRGGPAKLMSMIAPNMQPEEMAAVADFLAQLR